MKKKRFLFICIFLFSLSLCFAKISFWDRIINGTREIKESEKKEIIEVVNDFYKDYCTYDYEKIIRHFENEGREIFILHNGDWIIDKEYFDQDIAEKKYDFANKKWSYNIRDIKFHKHFLDDENMPDNAYDVVLDFSMEDENNWVNQLILIRENRKHKVYWLIVWD